MESILTSEAIIGFLTLTVLEIVLGIDNVVFISILSGKLPAGQQRRARRLGLAAAVITRLALLLSLSWIVGLTEPLVRLAGFEVTGRDLVLVVGGLFLLAKSTREIHDRLEGVEGRASARVGPSMASVILQIMLLDIVFSLDSVITAVGMVREIAVMAAAVIAAVGIMMWAAEPISHFVNRHPTVKILALSFLLLIGATLIIEGLHQHIPRGYIYFAMGFSVFVEMLNLRVRRPAAEPIHLREAYVAEEPKGSGAAAA